MKQRLGNPHGRMLHVLGLLATALIAPVSGGEANAHSEQIAHHGEQQMDTAPAEHRHMRGQEQMHMHEGGGRHWLAPVVEVRDNPLPATAGSVAEGEALFRENCVACHGLSRDGNGPLADSLSSRPADLNHMAAMHPDGDLAWKIANGRGDMPAWKDSLSEADIWNLVNYLKCATASAGKDDSHGHAGVQRGMADASPSPAATAFCRGNPDGVLPGQ